MLKFDFVSPNLEVLMALRRGSKEDSGLLRSLLVLESTASSPVASMRSRL